MIFQPIASQPTLSNAHDSVPYILPCKGRSISLKRILRSRKLSDLVDRPCRMSLFPASCFLQKQPSKFAFFADCLVPLLACFIKSKSGFNDFSFRPGSKNDLLQVTCFLIGEALSRSFLVCTPTFRTRGQFVKMALLCQLQTT